MSRHLHILAAGVCLSVVLVVTGAWLGAATMAPPPTQPPLYPEEIPDPIADGSGDIARFFKANQFTAPFKLMSALRDGALGRRYYRVRVAPEAVAQLRQRLASGWTWGHFNRAVYDDDHTSRLPRSHNLPAWWKQGSNAGVTLMLAHGTTPNWYVVINADGEVNLMWVGR